MQTPIRFLSHSLALSLLLASSALPAADLVLARRGAPAACTVVLPASPSESQRYAAAELCAYVKRMTGVELPVATDADPLPAAAILVGATRHTAAVLGCADGSKGVADDLAGLGEDGFRLVARGPHLQILASPVRGCLYGVYELLERCGGCRWYASWHTVVPETDAFAVPSGLDVRQTPDFAMRSSWWYDVNAHNDFAARLRVNTRPWGVMEPKYGGDSFKFCKNLQSCHTFDLLIPPAKYAKDHPDYFSRVPGDQKQPCLTHPDVLAIVTSNVLAQIRRDPDAKAYGVSQNDWYNYCTCPRCKAVDEEEGSHAGTMVRFVNAVAEAVEREFPGKIVETLAYQYTRKPPTKTKLRHNVVPCLCTIECDFAHPIPESEFAQNRSFMQDIVGWSPMTDQLYLWDYVTNFRHYPFPFPNCHALQGNLRFLRDHGAKEMFPEGDYQGNLADFAELKAWLLAKLMWHVDTPLEALLDDFFAGYYGAAAPYVRAYFDEIHAVRRAAAKAGHPLLIFESLGAPHLPDALFDRAAKLFERAKEAVKDDPVHAKNVRATAFSVDYVRFMRQKDRQNCLLWLREADPRREPFEERQRVAKRLLAAMEEFKPVRLSEDGRADARERALIQAAAGPVALPKRVASGCVEEKDLSFCRPASMGAFVDDPQAEDGRALKLFNTHYEWSTDLSLRKFAYDPGTKLRVRVRCRVERVPGRVGEAIWAGIYDWGEKRNRCAISVKAEKIGTDGYVWYDIGTFCPNDTQTFWIGPGQFGPDGKSNIAALYVDKAEFSVVR